jgi:hypothetical protein
MTRLQKLTAIRKECISANSTDSRIGAPVQLRHVVVALRMAKAHYVVGAEGYFLASDTFMSTGVRWNARQNDLANQDDDCIDFIYRALVKQTDDAIERNSEDLQLSPE